MSIHQRSPIAPGSSTGRPARSWALNPRRIDISWAPCPGRVASDYARMGMNFRGAETARARVASDYARMGMNFRGAETARARVASDYARMGMNFRGAETEHDTRAPHGAVL